MLTLAYYWGVITQINNKKLKQNDILRSVKLAAKVADEKKAGYIKVLDMRSRLVITDYFLIISANNPRLTKRIYEDIEKKLKNRNLYPINVTGAGEGNWILVDYDDFVIHILTNDFKDYYDLERLWRDSETIEWKE